MADTRKWKAEELFSYRAVVLDAMKKLDETTIVELIRRGEESAEIDGYPGGDAGDEGRRSIGGHSDPTQDAAINRINDTRIDQIGGAIEDIFTRLIEMSGHGRTIDKKRVIVLHAKDLAKMDNDVTSCKGCHRVVERTAADPIRGRYCSACSTAWYRWKETFGSDDAPTSRRFFEDQRTRFEGHQDSVCEVCVENAELLRHAEAS